MKKIAFYTDKPGRRPSFTREMFRAIYDRFQVAEEDVVYVHAKPTEGFESGVDWDEWARGGVTAVILYHVNDACVFGMSLEASNAGLRVFEVTGDTLYDVFGVELDGKEWVLDLK